MHLSTEVVLDLIENRATEPQLGFWKSHLEQCADCSGQLKDWSAMHSLLKRDHLESAPPALIDSVQAVFRKPRSANTVSLRETVASLVFDSFAQPALAGARGTNESRQMILRAEEFDIHVKIWGTAEERRLAGQILARGEGTFVSGARLHLLRDGERFETTSADKLGEFQFKEVPDGLLSLQIDLPHMTVVGALNVSELQ